MTPEGTTETPVPRKPEKPRLRPNEDPAFYEALGRAIKVARTQLGLERKELAEQANVSYAYLSDIETGRGRPSSRSLLKVAEALGRTGSELLQEAESYQQVTGTDEPGFTGSPWFHADRTSTIARPSRVGPSRSELRDGWRDRLEASDRETRERLHELVEELATEDAATLLDLARRLKRD
ncbi:MAG: helix-turn-helix domain-containing protein [Actinomycetota bacterium]